MYTKLKRKKKPIAAKNDRGSIKPFHVENDRTRAEVRDILKPEEGKDNTQDLPADSEMVLKNPKENLV